MEPTPGLATLGLAVLRQYRPGWLQGDSFASLTIGALRCVAVGAFFGCVAVLATPASVVNQLAIPTVTLAVYVVIVTIAQK